MRCDRADVERELADTDFAVPLMTPLPAAALQQAPLLKAVLQYGVGVEAIDIPAATELGIWVSNIPSAGTGNAASCAEMAVLLMLATLRNVNGMAESVQQRRIGVPLGSMLHRKSVLIVGFGNIAKELAVRLVSFGVKLSALRRRQRWGAHGDDPLSTAAEAALQDRGTWPEDLPRLVSAADIIVLTCHLDNSTKGMVNTAFLEHCSPGVHIVNVARGGLMDHAAVLEGLQSGKIEGMGLDVQFWEPFDPNDPIAEHPAVYLTPHVAGGTEQSCE